jgi:hypothetical protein
MTYTRRRAAKPATPARAKLPEKVEAAPVNLGELVVMTVETG